MELPTRTRKGPSGRKFADIARDTRIVEMFRSGMTSAEIAPHFGLAAAGVLKVLKVHGVKRCEGGKEVAARIRRDAAQLQRKADIVAAEGCSLSEFDSFDQFKEARRKFADQRQRAKERAIDWQMTLTQWWGVWRESGNWDKRGRSAGNSAVMARRGDVGPYSVANVYITTLAKNFTDSHVFRGHRIRSEASIAAQEFQCVRASLSTLLN